MKQLKNLLCKLGFHRWRTCRIGEINLLFPILPQNHDDECLWCGKVRRWVNTMYGSEIEKTWNNKDEYLRENKNHRS